MHTSMPCCHAQATNCHRPQSFVSCSGFVLSIWMFPKTFVSSLHTLFVNYMWLVFWWCHFHVCIPFRSRSISQLNRSIIFFLITINKECMCKLSSCNCCESWQYEWYGRWWNLAYCKLHWVLSISSSVLDDKLSSLYWSEHVSIGNYSSSSGGLLPANQWNSPHTYWKNVFAACAWMKVGFFVKFSLGKGSANITSIKIL